MIAAFTRSFFFSLLKVQLRLKWILLSFKEGLTVSVSIIWL